MDGIRYENRGGIRAADLFHTNTASVSSTGGLRVISINFDYFLQTKVRKVPGSGLGGIKVNPTLPLGISNLSVSEVSRVIGNV